MRFSAVIWPHSDAGIDAVVRLAKVAEDNGYDTCYVGDSQMLWHDVWVCLAACAAATDRIKLGAGVTNIVTRHPTVTVNAAMSLNMMSKGRAVLGIAAGDSALRTAGMSPVRLKTLQERIPQMKALLAGEEVDAMEWYDPRGEKAWGVETRMRVVGAKEWGRVPIHWAVVRPQSVEVAAEIADGLVVVGNLAGVEEGRELMVAALTRGAERAGRDPASVRVLFAAAAACDEDVEKAMAQVRDTAARAVANVGWLPDSIKTEHADAIKELKEHYKFYDHLDTRADHLRLVPDELARQTTIVGTREECIARCRELEAGGITDIGITGSTLDEHGMRENLELFARDIVPYV
jgi:5,10-methylenetetrahydromethanopterin reductase